MTTLPNGCRCSDITVTPSNWNTVKKSVDTNWKINYRFYDPTFEKPYQVTIRAGINTIADWNERKNAVKELINAEWHKLKALGFNPITNTFITPVEIDYEIDPETPFIMALNKAVEKLTVVHRTRIGIKGTIRGCEKAAKQLRFENLPISKVGRRHIKMVLERCGKNSERWSSRTYNLYRAYLLMLFKELVELEAVTANPVRDISKMKEFKKIRAIITDKQRDKVKETLAVKDPRFLNFIHLFFHSGGRLNELVKVKVDDVDLKKQKYKSVIRKGKSYREVERTIKDIALPYWEFFVQTAKPGQFLFGIDFLPADKPMVADTITRRWQRLVKKELGISADLYSLKHLNTTETVDAIGEEAAADQNGHTSTDMVKGVYDIRQQERKHQLLKRLSNEF